MNTPRRNRSSTLAGCLLLFCPCVSLLAPSTADGQDTHYQSFLVGERASGMGGAYTGIADDASAAFYNPAGLAMVSGSSFSGSLQVEAFNKYVVEDGYTTPVGSADLSHDDQPSLPIFVGIVKKFGPRNPVGERNHAIAISTYHPQRQSRRYRVDLFNPETNVETRLRVDSSNEVTWYGPSYAYRLNPCFSLGVSAFLATRRQRHAEDDTTITRGEFDPDLQVFRNPTLSLREMETEITTRHAVLRLGALWAVSEQFQLGFMVQPPGMLIHDSGSIKERLVFADTLGDPYGTFARLDQKVDVQAPIPWEVRVGAAYRQSSAFTMGLDVSVYGPNGSADDPIDVISGLRPDEETGATPQTGILQVRQWHREVTANVSAGAEWVIADMVPLRLGAFTNFSAAPSIDGPSPAYRPDNVDLYGATMSVGIRADGYDINLGALGSLGRGDGLARRPADDGSAAYLPTGVESQSFFVFINGHKAAASRIAGEVYQEVLNPR